MYCNFFGFTEKPFDVTPDPKFLYLSSDHREVFASLIYGIRERRGFIAVVGEVGTGKTTLLNAVFDRLDQKTKIAYIFNTDVTFEEMLNKAVFELGLTKEDEGLNKLQAVQRLNDFAIKQLAAGGNVVLIVDEAQNLDMKCMENLRLLSNLETRKYKLIQIVLSGQPELDSKLNRHELRQLAQRISLKRYVFPLSEKDTYEYIRHRIAVANFPGSGLFDRGSLEMVWQYSKGIPRRINMICDNALLIGYGLKTPKIKKDIVEEAIKDLTWSPFFSSEPVMPPVPQIPCEPPPLEKRRGHRGLPLAVSLSAAACLVLVLVFLFFHQGPWVDKRMGLDTFLEFLKKEKAPPALLKKQDLKASNRPVMRPDNTSAQVLVESPLERQGRDFRPSKKADLPADPSKPSREDARPAPSVKETSGSLLKTPASSISRAAQSLGEQDIPSSRGTARDAWGIHSPSLVLPRKGLKVTNRALGSGAKADLRDLRKPGGQVTIQQGDTLSEVIREAYGTYDEGLLQAVLLENPEIQSPDQIFVGQRLRLPAL